MNFWTTVKNWFLSWFVGSKELKIVEILEGLDVFFNKALPIVEKIDKELKPELKRITAEGDEIDIYETVLKFLEQYKDIISDIRALAEKVYGMQLPDLLFTIAIEILRAQSTTNASLSILRLAVELAYNVYKKTRN